jgi:Mrp family chromosome partitioning ATPase
MEIQKLLEMELQEVIQFLAQSHQPVVVAVVDLVLE